MTLVAVGSWRGTGATTTALLLAAAAAELGQDAWLVEADPCGGVLGTRVPALAGLDSIGSVAFAPTGERSDRALAASSRRLGRVHVVTAPADSFRAWSAAATPRFPWMDGLRRLGEVVIVDVGSLRGGQLPSWAVVDRCDLLVMVANPEPASLTTTVGWMDAKGQSAPGLAGLPVEVSRLIVVEAPTASGERFSAGVADEIGPRLLSWWPWEPRVVDHVHRGGSLDHRAVRRFPLVGRMLETAGRLESEARP